MQVRWLGAVALATVLTACSTTASRAPAGASSPPGSAHVSFDEVTTEIVGTDPPPGPLAPEDIDLPCATFVRESPSRQVDRVRLFLALMRTPARYDTESFATSFTHSLVADCARHPAGNVKELATRRAGRDPVHFPH